MLVTILVVFALGICVLIAYLAHKKNRNFYIWGGVTAAVSILIPLVSIIVLIVISLIPTIELGEKEKLNQ